MADFERHNPGAKPPEQFDDDSGKMKMQVWIYKCNSRSRSHQVRVGDWHKFFDDGRIGEWGSTKWIPPLAQAQPGDIILAFQTDRNELVGVARVTALKPRGRFKDLLLEPLERLGVKVRPLKRRDPKIRVIPALQPGPIRTLYQISTSDARRLLKAAGANIRLLREGAGNPATNNTRAGTGRQESDADNGFVEALEGTLTEVKRYVRARSHRLRTLAMQRAEGICEVCEVDFKKIFDGRGIRVLQVHHRRQLAAMQVPRLNKVSDLAVVCANCHMLIHCDPAKALSVNKVRNNLKALL